MSQAAAVEGSVSDEPDTLILALRAARQIDLARRGEQYDPGEIHALIDSLPAGAQATPSVERVRALAPIDVSVMTRAVSAYGGTELTTIEDLANTLDQLLGEIKQPLDKLEEDHLRNLIAFCVTLHDEMLSQKRSFQESRKLRSRYRV